MCGFWGQNSGYLVWPQAPSPTEVILPALFVLEGSHVAQASLELTMYCRLAQNSRQSACLSLPHAGMTGLSHAPGFTLVSIAALFTVAKR